jgi:hypothetical protein
VARRSLGFLGRDLDLVADQNEAAEEAAPLPSDGCSSSLTGSRRSDALRRGGVCHGFLSLGIELTSAGNQVGL